MGVSVRPVLSAGSQCMLPAVLRVAHQAGTAGAACRQQVPRRARQGVQQLLLVSTRWAPVAIEDGCPGPVVPLFPHPRPTLCRPPDVPPPSAPPPVPQVRPPPCKPMQHPPSRPLPPRAAPVHTHAQGEPLRHSCRLLERPPLTPHWAGAPARGESGDRDGGRSHSGRAHHLEHS